jgi:HD-GYP domain-containing protein (c-di-GMP phosphodiesterase class II)
VLAHTGVLPLLRAGVNVTESIRRSLQRAGVTSVWVDDELSSGIEPEEILSEETKQQAVAAIREAFLDSSQRLTAPRPVSEKTLAEMSNVVDMMIDDLSSNAQMAIALNDLANADAYTLKHSLAVATLGLSLGLRVMQKYGWTDLTGKKRLDSVIERLRPLGLGLILHDIGKVAIPPEILHKAGPLTDTEWKAVRAHPMTGVGMLQHSSVSPLTRAVVREHHERWNGSGYPDGKAGEEIHQFARIAGVADVFDALASDRIYRTGEPVNKVYDYIITRDGTDFDPEVVAIFKRSVAPFPIGTNVLLSDGTKGIVSAVREDQVMTPTVRVLLDQSGAAMKPREVDLSITTGLTIVSTCGGDAFEALTSKVK